MSPRREPTGVRARNVHVFRTRDVVVFITLTFLNLTAGGYFFYLCLAAPLSASRLVPVALLVLALVAWANHLVRWGVLPLMERPEPPPQATPRRVAVATSFVPSQEPLDMLARTLAAMVAIRGDHDTWLLDEGNDPRVRALCESLGVRHFSRNGRAEFNTDQGRYRRATKYGNYNAWFAEHGYENYDVITTLDPDHTPEPHFLERVLGYFEDPNIGYVQAAQVYGNQSESSIARGAAEETYGYYSSIQMAAYALGYPIVIGCHTTHRVAALRDVEGFPPHDAEDLLLTQYYRAAGWEGIYVPEVLARGLAPADWYGYLRQQRRWARSVLDIKLFGPPLLRKMPRATRLTGFVHGLNYLGRSLSIVLLILLAGIVLITGDAPVVSDVPTLLALGAMLAVCALCELYRQRFYLLDSERGLPWRTLMLDFAKWPHMLAALYQVITRKKQGYTITPKQATNAGSMAFFWHQYVASAALGVAWGVGRARGVELPAGWQLLPLLPAVGAFLASRAGAVAERELNVPSDVSKSERVQS